MIVFTHDPNLIEPIFFHSKCNGGLLVLNLSSMYSGYGDITNLITQISPINDSGLPAYEFVDSVNFDFQYAAALESNPELYTSFMQIILHSYNDVCVIILVYRDPYRDAVMESLIKYIQQKYKMNSWIIEDIYDIDMIIDSVIPPSGMMQINSDILRCDEMYQNGQITERILPPICQE